uniref:Uncharacterized protein n=1 Tax=uncultured marine thaumarchaeote AD1000_89_F09 TaxID=1455947 RepID=A0A075G5B6_9ARCH|nr:hypothetical protein [uncultured marine thaumarchaeote AD1000_89_F09]
MNIIEANKIFRKSIIKSFFEEELVKLDFKKSNIKHATISGDGLMQSNLLHIFLILKQGQIILMVMNGLLLIFYSHMV